MKMYIIFILSFIFLYGYKYKVKHSKINTCYIFDDGYYQVTKVDYLLRYHVSYIQYKDMTLQLIGDFTILDVPYDISCNDVKELLTTPEEDLI